MRAELADGRILEFPDGTDPAVIQSTVKKMLGQVDAKQAPIQQQAPVVPAQPQQEAALQVEAPAQEAGAREQVNQAILSTPIGRGLAELGAATGRGATEMVDFFISDPVNAALELAGSEARMPTLTETLAPATKGEFLEPGLAKDVIRAGGELIAPGGAVGAATKAAARALPKIGQAGEGVARGVLRQAGTTKPAAEALTAGIAGGGAVVGGEIGEEVAGETGRVVGEQLGALLAPISASVVKNTGKTFVTGSAKKLLKESAPTIEGLKDTARKVYKQIDDLGAVVNSNRTDRLAKQIASTVNREGFDPTLHPKVAVTLSRFADKEGQDLAVSEIDTLRKIAKAAASSLDPDEKRIGMITINKIDDFLDDLKPQHFKRGSGEVGALYKDARQLWGRAKKAEIIEEAFTKARLQATGFENGIRIQFRSILNNKKKRTGFTKEEIDAMQQVVKGGKLENLAKMIGRFGFSEGQASNMLLGSLGAAGGFAAGGIGGGVAVPLIGQVSRGLAQKLTRNNAELANSIVKAGKNGSKVVIEYMKAVPKGQRDVKELTELLMRPEVGLKQIRVATSTKEQKALIENAVFYAEALRQQKAKEGDEQQIQQVQQQQVQQ